MDLQKSDAKILLRFMIAMASADGKLHAEEIGVIAAVFEKIAGHPLDERLLQDMFDVNRKEQFSIFDDDSFAAEFSPELKRLIVKACYLVKIADREIAESELDMMATIAARLDISGIELSQMIREVSSG
jgi:tellurite resistance protein